MHFGIVLEEEKLGIAAGSPTLAVEARGLPEMLLEDLGEILAVHVAAALGDFRNGQAAPGQEAILLPVTYSMMPRPTTSFIFL